MASVTRKAILRALIEGVLTDLMVKTGADNVYIDDTTTLAAKLAEIVTAINLRAKSTDVTAEIKSAVTGLAKSSDVTKEINTAVTGLAKSSDVTAEINAAISGLINGAPETYDTLKEISDYIANHADVTEAINAAIAGKADRTTVQGIQSTIAALGSLAKKSVVSESDLDAGLKEKVNAASEGNHSHNNKALLDTYTQTEANLADAVAKKHAHGNKAVLDGINATLVTEWNSKGTVFAQASQPSNLATGDLWIQLLD